MTRKYVMFGLLLVVESMSAGVVLVIEANYCWPCDAEECQNCVVEKYKCYLVLVFEKMCQMKKI